MLIEHLQKIFAERSRKNPKYSLRAFANSLDLDSSTLSAILRGKRPLTSKMAMKLIDRLEIEDPLQMQLLLMGTIGGQDAAQKIDYAEFDMASAEVVGSWEHFAILSVLELSKTKSDTKSIAKRLNIPMGVAMEALYRMEKLGLIQKSDTSWKLTGKNMSTPTNIPNTRLRAAHRQHIERALESLEKDSVQSRDITGITMAINSKKLTEAKNLIQDFRRRLSAFLEAGDRDSVYRLNVQLFPLTQENPK
ncbi:TIGR02147 family protein [Bdellovibrio sp. HCB337]|uniref:TIGR02147 family protein n=1 Tax=Bdellovibrio sp. HCB337 TaxID=3394358 RepID=UPI0039A6AF3B